MTRHTPEFLRARSNASLRALAMEQSMTLRMGGTADAVDAGKAHAKDLKPEAFTKPYLDFMTENPTVFHAVGYFKEKLAKAGYKEVGHRMSTAHLLISNRLLCVALQPG